MTRIKYKEVAGLEVKRGKLPIGKKPGKTELKRDLFISETGIFSPIFSVYAPEQLYYIYLVNESGGWSWE